MGANTRNIPTTKKKYYHRSPIDGGFAVGIDCSVYDEIVDECSKKIFPPDTGAFKYIVNKYPEKIYVVYPNLIIADVSISGVREGTDMKKFALIRKWNLENYDC